MTLHGTHPIESTRQHVRYAADYKTIVRVPVMRRIFGLTLRMVHVDVLLNECGIVRVDWDTYYTFGCITIAVVRKGE